MSVGLPLFQFFVQKTEGWAYLGSVRLNRRIRYIQTLKYSTDYIHSFVLESVERNNFPII